ncbi:MAG: TonB-dependent receptor, partial [Bacteroidota bacterium]|nr:TonB-dependent receptor [Bacteroidota bacterium]
MIDGVLENDIWKGLAWIDKQYPLSNIKQIEIIYGPASALYGANAFQGIINIVTKNGLDNSNLINTSIGYGSYNTFITEIMIGKKINNFDFNFTFRKYNSNENDLSEYKDWDYIIPNGENFSFPVDKYINPKDNIAFHWKMKYKGFSFGGVLWDRADYSGMTYVDSYLSGTKYAANFNSPWHIRNMHSYIMYETDISANIHSQTRISLFNHEHLPSSNAIGLSYTDSMFVTFFHEKSQRAMFEQQFNFNFNFNKVKNFLTIGIQYKYSNIQGNYEKLTIGYPIGGTFPITPDISDFKTHDIYLTKDLGIYFQEVIKPIDNLSIILGSRFDYNKIRKDGGFGWVFNPRLGLVYFPFKKLNIKMLYGSGFSPATNWTLYSTTYSRQANPNLAPEIVNSHEISSGYKILNSLYIEAAYYFNFYKNRASVVKYPSGVLDPENPDIIERNEAIGNWSITGFELRIKFNYQNFAVIGNYSYSNPFDIDTKLEIGNIGNTANLIVNYKISKHINFNLRTNWIGERNSFLRDSNNVFLLTIKPAFIANSTLIIKNLFVKNLSFSITINNIFDSEYFDPGMRSGTGKYPAKLPQNGRFLFFKLSYSF